MRNQFTKILPKRRSNATKRCTWHCSNYTRHYYLIIKHGGLQWQFPVYMMSLCNLLPLSAHYNLPITALPFYPCRNNYWKSWQTDVISKSDLRGAEHASAKRFPNILFFFNEITEIVSRLGHVIKESLLHTLNYKPIVSEIFGLGFQTVGFQVI